MSTPSAPPASAIDSPAKTPTKGLTPQQKLAQARAAKKQQYYSTQTPQQATEKAKDYQEKKQIEKELHKENRKFEIDTKLMQNKLTDIDKRQDAEYVHRLKLQAQLDQKQREEEEVIRNQKVENLRRQREIKEAEEARILKERLAALENGTYLRDDKKKSKKDNSSDDESSKGHKLGADPNNSKTTPAEKGML